MCCSIPNTILKDVKCIGESLQKISWTLLMIKDRQNEQKKMACEAFLQLMITWSANSTQKGCV